MTDSSQRWDANLYDSTHAFVWRHGSSLVELLDPKPGERILDLGCGTGHLTAQIAESGAFPVGLDHSEEMLAQARSAYPQLEFLQGDARDFAFDQQFDGVFSNAVLHWVKEPKAVVRCVADALKPGGRFVAEFGGKGNVRAVVDALQAAAEQLGLRWEGLPWYFPGVGEYATLLEEEGLEVRFAALFDRPTALEGPGGLRDWTSMFGRWLLDKVPAQRRDHFFQTLEKTAQPVLFRDGSWFADYRRLRVVAVRLK